MTEIYKAEKDRRISAQEFQQAMFEGLGDRDYDCFECEEHEHLKNKLRFMLFDPNQANLRSKEKRKIEKIYSTIRKTNNAHSQWDDYIVVSFIYNCTETIDSSTKDIHPVPVFVVRKCQNSKNPCRMFIDTDLRTYKSWEKFLRRNRLPKCNMILPLNGKYKADSAGNVLLEERLSPECTKKATVLKYGDVAATTIGLASGGVLLTALFFALPPAVIIGAAATGVGTAVYSIGRSSMTVHDRRIHRQNMSFKNPEARNAYFGIVANSFGIASIGVTSAVAVVASRGIQIGRTTGALVNSLNHANTAVTFSDLVNNVYGFKYGISPEQIFQVVGSVLFFGNTILHTALTKGRILQHEIAAFQKTAKTGRKCYNQRSTEVVSSLRTTDTKDIMKTLSRSNDSSGLQFTCYNNTIFLNNVAVQILKKSVQNFDGMPVPPTQQVTDTSVCTISVDLKETFFVDKLRDITAFDVQLINSETDVRMFTLMLSRFPSKIQSDIIGLIKDLIDELEKENLNFVEIFDKIYTRVNYLHKILEVTIHFLVNKYEEDLDDNEEATDVSFVHMLVQIFLEESSEVLSKFVQYFKDWLTTECYEFENTHMKYERRKLRQVKLKRKVICNKCSGYYYTYQ